MIQIDDKDADLLVSALQLKSDDISRRMGLKGAKDYRVGMALELEACERLKAKIEKPALAAVK